MVDDRKTATFRFYKELNDFLPPNKRKVDFRYMFSGKPAVKDTIEAIGVPHTEVDVILVNANSVDFAYHLQNEDSVLIYPKFELLDMRYVIRLCPKPLHESKFVLDVHLGKLAKYLRLFGFDTLFESHYQDSEIVTLGKEQRIILTRDIGLLKNGSVTNGYWVRNIHPKKQLKEIMQRFDLYNQTKPFTRCLECNHPLIKVDKEIIRDLLPPKTYKFYQDFSRCMHCKKVYWEGSHFQHMKKFIADVVHTG